MAASAPAPRRSRPKPAVGVGRMPEYAFIVVSYLGMVVRSVFRSGVAAIGERRLNIPQSGGYFAFVQWKFHDGDLGVEGSLGGRALPRWQAGKPLRQHAHGSSIVVLPDLTARSEIERVLR